MFAAAAAAAPAAATAAAPIVAANVADCLLVAYPRIGHGRYRSPRHRMPCNSINEYSNCAPMTWRAISARPYPRTDAAGAAPHGRGGASRLQVVTAVVVIVDPTASKISVLVRPARAPAEPRVLSGRQRLLAGRRRRGRGGHLGQPAGWFQPGGRMLQPVAQTKFGLTVCSESTGVYPPFPAQPDCMLMRVRTDSLVPGTQ